MLPTHDIVIGLDCGTQSSKACAWDLGGALVRGASRPLSVSSPCEGWAEQAPGEWWTSACTALRAACAGLDASRIAALGLAFQRESFALLDATGAPCRPGMLWLDVRAANQAGAVDGLLGPGTAPRETGKPLDATGALPRLLWLKENEPGAVARAARWADVGSFLVERLTGRNATCRAGADTCGLVDLRTGGWRMDWLSALGFGALSMPELLAPGTIAGSLAPAAARDTGLPAGLPVVLAGGDGQVLRVGLGCPAPSAAAPSGWSLTLGTSIVIAVGSASAEVAAAWRTLPAADPEGGFVREAVLQSGTWALRWLEQAVGSGAASEGSADDSLAGVRPGADGLLAFPHFWGARFPESAPDARGAFVGLTHGHGPAELHRALLEGTAFELRRMAEGMATVGAPRPGPVAVTGGGARSRTLLGIIASALGQPMVVPREAESVALGAAMLAARAIGRFRSTAEAQSMAHASRRIEPDPALSSAYRQLYARRWLPTLRRLAPVCAQLAGLVRPPRPSA